MEFKFKEKSSKEYNLIFDIKKYPIFKKPRYETVEIPGKQGDIKFFMGYEDLICEIDILIKGKIYERIDTINKIQNWLCGIGKLKLENIDELDMTVIDISGVEKYKNHEIIKVIFSSAISKDIEFIQEKDEESNKNSIYFIDYIGYDGLIAECLIGEKTDV